LNRLWMREHFVRMHQRRELETQIEMVRQANEAAHAGHRMAKLEAEKKRAAMEGQFRFTIAGEEEKLRNARKAQEKKEREAQERTFEKIANKENYQPALKVFEEWMRNNDQDKDIMRAALVRIKLPRQTPHQHHDSKKGREGD